jgi:MtN3 and saliva related transmembrane protein
MGDPMGLVSYVGTAAAICTTGAFIPQILKIRKQGGDDLSYPMLFLYLTGVLLWLGYGFLLHASAVIWANGLTSILVLVALAMKASYPATKDSAQSNR